MTNDLVQEMATFPQQMTTFPHLEGPMGSASASAGCTRLGWVTSGWAGEMTNPLKKGCPFRRNGAHPRGMTTFLKEMTTFLGQWRPFPSSEAFPGPWRRCPSKDNPPKGGQSFQRNANLSQATTTVPQTEQECPGVWGRRQTTGGGQQGCGLLHTPWPGRQAPGRRQGPGPG